MNFFSLIFSLAFALFAGLAALVGALRGRKYKWELSLARIIVAVLAAIAAAGLAAFLANLIISIVLSILLNQDWFNNIGGLNLNAIIDDVPSAKGAIRSLASMIVAPILFWPLFAIIKAIANIFVKMITNGILALTDKDYKKYKEQKEHNDDTVPEVDSKGRKYIKRHGYKAKYEPLVAHHTNYAGGALGAFCSVIILCISLIPLTGLFKVADRIAPIALETLSKDERYGGITTLALDVVDGAANSAASQTVNVMGGTALYGFMTTCNVGGEMTNLNSETRLIASAADIASAVLSDGMESDEAAAAIRRLPASFNKSAVFRVTLSDLCNSASTEWSEGNSFHGIPCPNFGATFKPLTDAVIDVFATSDKENIKDDVKAISEIMAIVSEEALINDFQSMKTNPQAVLSDEKTNEKIILVILEDQRLDPLMDGIADFGITMMLNSVKTPVTRQILFDDFVDRFVAVGGSDAATLTKTYTDVLDDYGIPADELAPQAAAAKLSSSDMRDWFVNNVARDADDYAQKTVIVSLDMLTEGRMKIKDKEHEAKALAHAFAVISGMTDDFKGDAFDVKHMLTVMGSALDAFSETELVGSERTTLMLEAILQSPQVHDQMGFSVMDATNTAKSIAENSSHKSYSSVMTSLSGVVEMLEAASDTTKNTKEAVDKMLKDLTPEAASVMETMATPNVVQNYGVPEKSADSVANMISGTFGNLKDVPAEDYDKEASAVSDMMNVMMSITEDGASGSTVFGGEDSVTQITEQQYVDNIMSSSAMSKTVVDTVYGESGEPKVDPLNSGRKLSDTESESLVNALNNNWNSSAKDEETKKEITAIAAIMNINVNVSDAGVEIVEQSADQE